MVYDAKTGDDITRSVLTQIIFEEESKGGQNLLPIPFLRQLIAFYGDNLQGVVPQYLEMSMSAVRAQPGADAARLQNAFGFNPFQQFEAMGKQNMAMFEKAMRMFNPFSCRAGRRHAAVGPANGQEPLKTEPGRLRHRPTTRPSTTSSASSTSCRTSSRNSARSPEGMGDGPPPPARDVALHRHLHHRWQERPLPRLQAHHRRDRPLDDARDERQKIIDELPGGRSLSWQRGRPPVIRAQRGSHARQAAPEVLRRRSGQHGYAP